MKVVTAEEMRALDRRAIGDVGIPSAVLMENAGRAVFRALQDSYGPLRGRAVTVLCGTGNNGGDGFVIARHLHLSGAAVAVKIAGDPERTRGDARTNLDVLRRIGVKPMTGAPPSAIKVDALLGTGATGPPRAEIAEAIRWLNADPHPTVAVDVPSGVDSDTGATPGDSVRASVTVTLGYPKLGLFLAPGADRAGELVVDDIGFAWDSLGSSTPYQWLRPAEMTRLLPRRPRESQKGLFGHLLIVGGSRGMSGAPTMAARAALRAGAGLVTVAAPQTAQTLIAPRVTEAMTLALPEENGALASGAAGAVLEMAKRCDVVCLGPGSTREPGAQEAMIRVIREVTCPLVIDADGLNALAEHPEAARERAAPTVLTPHPGECARLLVSDVPSVQADRVAAVQQAASRYRAVVVLKGARSLIADGRAGDEPIPVAVNTTGNPGMATGGSGDSLTGIIGALIGQRLDAFDAACLGVYLHGRAGDHASGRTGEMGMIAGDISESLPEAISELETCHETVL